MAAPGPDGATAQEPQPAPGGSPHPRWRRLAAGERKWPLLLAALVALNVLLGPAWLLAEWWLSAGETRPVPMSECWMGPDGAPDCRTVHANVTAEAPTRREAVRHLGDWLEWDVAFMLRAGFLLQSPLGGTGTAPDHAARAAAWAAGWAALPTVFWLARPAPLARRVLYGVAAALLLSGMGSDNWTSFD